MSAVRVSSYFESKARIEREQAEVRALMAPLETRLHNLREAADELDYQHWDSFDLKMFSFDKTLLSDLAKAARANERINTVLDSWVESFGPEFKADGYVNDTVPMPSLTVRLPKNMTEEDVTRVSESIRNFVVQTHFPQQQETSVRLYSHTIQEACYLFMSINPESSHAPQLGKASSAYSRINYDSVEEAINFMNDVKSKQRRYFWD